MGIFDTRRSFKPFEYPEIEEYKFAISHAFWLFSEYNYTSDVHDFHINCSDKEKNAIKNALLAISQIEVAVKSFWGKIGDKIPKPEIQQVGATYAESEVRHSDAYSNLLTLLGLESEFEKILEHDVINGRVEYLTKYLKGAADNTKESFVLTLALFSLFVENISLFSQFLIIKSFNKYKNYFKGIDNVIAATSKEEDIHAKFGAHLINIIKAEFPEWFNEEFYEKIYRAAKKAFDAECKIVDWIFESGEIDFLSTNAVKEYIKNRFNESVVMIGGEKVFEIDTDLLSETIWFDIEIKAETSTDFFHKRPVSYSRKTQSITAEDLF